MSADKQDKDDIKLLDYCKDNHHWSVFEMCNAVVEVEAPRDITRQILRHRSFSFQEFSQRYSDNIEFTPRELRKQDYDNRQNSFDFSEKLGYDYCADAQDVCSDLYRAMRDVDVAKETARVVLPEGLTMSRMYVNGNLRSWLHYLEVRLHPSTQKEHRILAGEIKKCLAPAFGKLFKE